MMHYRMWYYDAYALHALLLYVLHPLHIDTQFEVHVSEEGQDFEEVIE